MSSECQNHASAAPGMSRSVFRTHVLLKGRKSAGLGKVYSSLIKPRHSPNSYLLERLKHKVNVVWKVEIVLSEVFCRFPAANKICRLNTAIELNGQCHGGENDL